MSIVRNRGRVRVLSLAVGLIGAACGSWDAFAEDVAPYVLRDGRRVGVTRSESEVGVVFYRDQDARKSGARLQAKGVGTIRHFNKNPDGRVKILQYPSGVLKLSTILLQSDVEEIRPVYRFAGFPDAPAIGTGTLVVRTRTTLSDAAELAIWTDHGVHWLRDVPLQANTVVLGIDDETADEFTVAAALAADVRVLWAQPNLRRTIERYQVAVSDPFFAPRQWHLNNTGQLAGTVDADIDALEAWSFADGQDILIGMFDDACDVDHEDLRDGYTGTGHDPSVSDSNSQDFKDPRPKQIGDNHGTRVMGLAAARGNSRGGRGVAFQSNFTVSRGLSEAITDAEVASVFTFAIQQSVDVHNNSWGSPGPNAAVIEDVIELAFRQGRNKGDLDGDEEDTDDRRGMVILFATGNDGRQNVPGFALSSLPWVLGIGGSSDLDRQVSYSNFANEIEFLAPTLEDGRPGVFTTDNTDDPQGADSGANIGGVNTDNGQSEPDPTGNYTAGFSGTSAACPIATGVAALVLSVNPLLTAIDVRLVMAHTADRINPTDAAYDGITGHSLKYGYGRLNAKSAADAANQALGNGGRTWPDSVATVAVANSRITFEQNVGTDEFLIVQSDADFDFVPVDGKCYDKAQLGCLNIQPEALPSGVTMTTTGCSLTCAADDVGTCELGSDHCVEFLQPSGKLFFAIYARSSSGRYSFGVATDSDGNIRGAGEILATLPDSQSGGGGGGGGDPTIPADAPAVTISASPISGRSPLTVRFTGNAISARSIDESRTAWDFDTSDGTIVNASSRNTSHTYDALAGERRVYTARLTMFDVDGNLGSAQVNITVDGPPSSSSDGNISSGDINIIVAAAGSPDSNVTSGVSPFGVILSVNSASLPGTLQSIRWDLGDGSTATSLTVPHTYINIGENELRLAVSATVTTATPGGAAVTTTAIKLITVKPGTATLDPGDPNLPGAGVSGGSGRAACGSLGMIPLLLMATPLWIRRRRA